MSKNLINPVENEDFWEARSSPSEAKSARGAQMFKGGGGRPPSPNPSGGPIKKGGGEGEGGLAEGGPPLLSGHMPLGLPDAKGWECTKTCAHSIN